MDNLDNFDENELKALFVLISRFGWADAMNLAASEYEARCMINALYKLEKILLKE